MGVRSRLKKLADRFSGEHSDAAPEGGPIPYEWGDEEAGSSPVLKARLKRPRDHRSERESSEES